MSDKDINIVTEKIVRHMVKEFEEHQLGSLHSLRAILNVHIAMCALLSKSANLDFKETLEHTTKIMNLYAENYSQELLEKLGDTHG